MGTAMFAKVLRIVVKWYGNPTSQEVFPQIFEDAVYAWKTGEFEGVSVFQAPDPGAEARLVVTPDMKDEDAEVIELQTNAAEVGKAEMRIDLSRIGGQ